ncbi:hypothetical protein BD769DRAFT_1503901 [Suillus cothurnatus]|nr:hypothetical protein BD769DRAFT_1503901 [Suillus cothurnatus]
MPSIVPERLLLLVFIPRSLALVLFFSRSSFFFMPHRSHHPYAYCFHGTLVLTAFVRLQFVHYSEHNEL